MTIEIAKQLEQIVENHGVRVVTVKTSQSFGETIYHVFPHVGDLFNCDLDAVCDSIEAAGFKTEMDSTTIKVK